MKSWRYYSVGLVGLALLGCNSEEAGFGCPDVVNPGIAITVLDDKTGDAISCGSSATLQESSYEETLTHPEGITCEPKHTLQGAIERVGFYNVTVMKQGYEHWYAYDVEVSEGVCGVDTVQLEVRLVKQ
ncbi:hypothetical protein [Agarivorans sp. 1_MG-2023]|uniref:hypothetical protein n=1 Tax=Agarivorans sp. 1_MG-2023 TaxID=3062634 RepID=UPI0026E41971|nr:hypothetical protein [Agarivorans sp. 1_MG-2023]MDO6763419.1 hypothetical protein [Agarivorans sp. 1_MG-2023]